MNKQTLKTTIMVKKEVEEPIEVQICPICGTTPHSRYYTFRFDTCTDGKEREIFCPNCGLTARLKDWNKLYYEEDKQCK